MGIGATGVAVAMAAVTMQQAGMGDGAPVGQLRDAVARWVETRKLISTENREWDSTRDMLEQRIGLLEREASEIEERTRERRQELAGLAEDSGDLAAEQASLEEIGQALSEAIPGLEAKAQALLPAFPEPLRQRVEPLARRLPAADVEPPPLPQRYQAVLGILNEADKFARDVTVVNEVRPLPDGSRAEVQVLYLGLGQGWYVSADGRAAGLGSPGEDGWAWSPRNDLADEVALAIAILRNEDVPSHVPLPVTVR